jgi:hypothetical protein
MYSESGRRSRTHPHFGPSVFFCLTTHSFSDGTLLEVVRTSNPEIFSLLSWIAKVWKVSEQIQQHGERFAPIRIDPRVSRALRFPRGVVPAEKTRDLFNATHRLFSSHLHQPESCTTQLFAIVFASWLFDRPPQARGRPHPRGALKQPNRRAGNR